MTDNSNSSGDEREALYRDVWGSEPAGQRPPRRSAPPTLPGDVLETPVQELDPRYERMWEPGGRLRALELEVRELRTAIQSLQRSTKGSIGALRSSIRKLSEVLGAEPEREPRQSDLSADLSPTPLPPDQAAEAQ